MVKGFVNYYTLSLVFFLHPTDLNSVLTSLHKSLARLTIHHLIVLRI